MDMIKLKKVNQNYLKKILLQYPNISSGRKNYIYQYKRILKNILLSKVYIKKIIPQKDNLIIIDNKLLIKIKKSKK